MLAFGLDVCFNSKYDVIFISNNDLKLTHPTIFLPIIIQIYGAGTKYKETLHKTLWGKNVRNECLESNICMMNESQTLLK